MENYNKIKILGQGSFATAWLVEDSSRQKLVLKLYKPEAAAQARREFLFLSALDNANIPAVINFSDSPAQPALVMEYITGKIPHAVDFADNHNLPDFFFQLCNQLVTIQAAGICLNDLKPDNIVLKNDGTPWLLDLGLATTNNYCDGIFRGNIAYSSPEKFRYKTSNFASDIFALGILYFYLKSGSHPSKSLSELSWQKLLEDRFAYDNWLVNQNLPAFIKSILAYDPASRPSAVQALNHFASLSGKKPKLRWSLLNDYFFPAQQALIIQLFQNQRAVCNPADEIDKLENRIILLAESAGKPAFIIRDSDLVSQPDTLLASLNSFAGSDLKDFSQLAELPLDLFYFVLILQDSPSPLSKILASRSDSLTLRLDNSHPPILLNLPDIIDFHHSVTAAPLTDDLPDQLSISAARLWLQSRLLSDDLPEPATIIKLAASIKHPMPLALAELLDDNWLPAISSALHKGYVKLTGSDFVAVNLAPHPLPEKLLKQFQETARSHDFLFHAGLIALLLNDNSSALKDFSAHYRLLTSKGYFASAWQLIALLEQRIGWQNLDFKLQKAKAFVTRRLGEPKQAVRIYQSITTEPGSRQEATIQADLAIALQENNQLDDAITANQNALRFFRFSHDSKSILRCLNNLAAIYYQQINYHQSSQLYLEILEITDQISDSEFARNYHLIAQINLADIFLHRAQWKRSLSYARNAAENAILLDLVPFRLQAEIIALAARFALGINDDLSIIINDLLAEPALIENPALLHEIAATALYISQISDTKQADGIYQKLLEESNSTLSDFLLFALYCQAWQNRKIEDLLALSKKLSDSRYSALAELLLKAQPEQLALALQKLARQDDAWLYIFFATQLAIAELPQAHHQIAAEIDSLLNFYSFAPLQKILAAPQNSANLHQQLLWDVVTLIHNNTEYPDIIAAVLQSIIRITQLDRAVFFAYDSGSLTPRQAVDKNLAPLDNDSIQVSQTILLDTLENNEISFLSGLQDDSEFDIHSSIFGLGLRSAVCFPLRFGDSLQGVIYSDAQNDRMFSPDEKKLLSSIFFQAHSALEKAVLIQNIKHQQLKQLSSIQTDFDSSIIGSSPAMQKVYQLIKLVAEHNVNILITGATGTGKELVAKALHNRYAPQKPFIPLNCAAIPENLLESELFGYMKGAFTGADQNRKGLLETASGGTLFLDEIGDMPLNLQAKLLRVLQERLVTPLGSHKSVPVDIRLISATNSSLEVAVDNGSFRQDLFYRLKVIQIELPSLSQRREDIPLLIQHFIKRFNKHFDKDIKGISPAALQMLQNKNWLGNVRQLENEIERAMVLCQKSELSLDLFDTSNLKKDYSMADNMPLTWYHYKTYRRQFTDNLDDIYAKKLLKAAKNNISTAARIASISRTQLYRLLNRKE